MNTGRERVIALGGVQGHLIDAFWVMRSEAFNGQLMHTWASDGGWRTAEIPEARVNGVLRSGVAAQTGGQVYVFWEDDAGLHLSYSAGGSWTTARLDLKWSSVAAFTHGNQVFLLGSSAAEKEKLSRIATFKGGKKLGDKLWDVSAFMDSPAVFHDGPKVNVLWASEDGTVSLSSPVESADPSGAWNHERMSEFKSAPGAVAGGVVNGKVHAMLSAPGNHLLFLSRQGPSQWKKELTRVKGDSPLSGISSPGRFDFFWRADNLWTGWVTSDDKNTVEPSPGLDLASEPAAAILGDKPCAFWRSRESFLKVTRHVGGLTWTTGNAATLPRPFPALAVAIDEAGGDVHVLWGDGPRVVALRWRAGGWQGPSEVTGVPPPVPGEYAALVNHQGVDVFYPADGAVHVASFDGKTWSSRRLADELIGHPVSLEHARRRAAFWTRQTDHHIYEAYQENGKWQVHRIGPFTAEGSPSVTWDERGRYLFWRKQGSKELYLGTFSVPGRDASDVSANDWSSVEVAEAGKLESDPVAFSVQARLHVLWLQGPEIRGLHQDGGWKPLPPLRLDLKAGERPSRIRGITSGHQLLIFWRNPETGALVRVVYDVAARKWEQPKTIVESSAASEPTVISAGGHAQLYWMDPERAVWRTLATGAGWKTEKLANPLALRGDTAAIDMLRTA